MPVSEARTCTFYYLFYCDDCKETFSVPVEKAEEEIPERHRSRLLGLLAEGRELVWPFDESLSEEDARKMVVHCPNGEQHLVEFVWSSGVGDD
jgi:hypothetical protein